MSTQSLGFQAHECLCACATMVETWAIGINGIGGISFRKTFHASAWEARLDVSPQGCSNYHSSHLCGVSQCFLDDL